MPGRLCAIEAALHWTLRFAPGDGSEHHSHSMNALWVKPGQFFAKEHIEYIAYIDTETAEDGLGLGLHHVVLKTGTTLLMLAPILEDRGIGKF